MPKRKDEIETIEVEIEEGTMEHFLKKVEKERSLQWKN